MHKSVQLVEIQRAPLFATITKMNKSIYELASKKKVKKVQKEW